MSSKDPRFFQAYANLIVRRPLAVILVLLALGGASTWAATKLTINSNQLDLISQELDEVKDVKRVIDMVGGSGFLMLALRSNEADLMKKVADDVAAMLRADAANVRAVTYKQPVQFVQENMVLFVATEDLKEVKRRFDAVIQDRIRRNNPFFIELRPTKPKQLELDDIVQKYSSVGKKSIRDEYYISDDSKMVIILIKPMWDGNELDKTRAFVETLNERFVDYSGKNLHGVKLVEDYELMGDRGTIAYGYTGSYKTTVDDSYAIHNSLHPISILAFVLISVIVALFFRRVAPSLMVVSGMVLGTVITMGFTYVTIGQLNMVTSILAGILMGFGVDYGIHLTYRTRIELGLGKTYDVAVRDALINAGRPALVSAIVTGGAFMMLLVSEFAGFSQFGFLAGCGTLIIGVTMFSWCGAIIVLMGRKDPELPARLIGTMKPPSEGLEKGDVRVPRPKLVLGLSTLVVLVICAFAYPWRSGEAPAWGKSGFIERFGFGTRFNYNTRALMPEDQYSVKLQDEINQRFKISSDPTGIFSPDLEGARRIFAEMTDGHPFKVKSKYSTVDQVVSVFSFVPPPEIAAANVKILEQWKEELRDFDWSLVPEEYVKYRPLFEKILDAKPFDVSGVPEVFKRQFSHLGQTKPENRGWLTFVYPRVDLWDGKQMLEFSDQTFKIRPPEGGEYRSAGGPILYARLARIVLKDGKLTLILTAIWILLMHYLDFRSVRLALASVIPLGVGLLMCLGIMAMVDHRLNFMNIIMLPILLGFGVSHGLYLLHRFLEGTSPLVALRSVGAAVASSTLTAVAGFASLFIASHQGLKSMGFVSCLGLLTTLIVSFTVLAAVLQLLHDQRSKGSKAAGARDAA